MKAAVREVETGRWTVENGCLAMTIDLDGQGVPVLSRLVHTALPDVDRGVGCGLGPVVEIGEATYRPDGPDMVFVEAEVDEAGAELCLKFRCSRGLSVRHYLRLSPDKPVWRSWTMLTNDSAEDIEDIRRFDALSLRVETSEGEPWAAYMLGWLDGPRADAPGKHAVPFPYPSWIPRLLYGDGAPSPPPPPEGWALPAFRLIRERLTRLPLRSGKRSTYDNHPWLTVLDRERGGGLFAGLEWSGTWKMDADHDPSAHSVILSASTDGDTHILRAGASLTSPSAFVGLFAGDWDDAFNACRRYVRDEILPEPLDNFPPVHYNIGSAILPRFTPSLMRSEIDTAVELGFERFAVDAMWWNASQDQGEFSIGLGDFTESRRKFPHGLRALSDYVHEKGMKFGLWFEFERVDLRTANRGRHPWSPSWLVHQNGHAYRSWCQHVYLLCLGVKAAANWALENISWAIETYGVEWMKIDGNEWAVCDDTSHDHGPADGEWAQVQGLYYVLRNLCERFPDLIIENCAGGSQRGDFGMARFCRVMHCHDTHYPSALNRRLSHGAGTMYPTSYGIRPLYVYPGETAPQRLEWRVLNRLMGTFQSRLELTSMGIENQRVMQRTIATYKRLRPTLNGDRYVLDAPPVIYQPENREAGSWEVYEYVSPHADLVSVFFYRCMSPDIEHRALLKGLAPDAGYRIEFHSGRVDYVCDGAELMEKGLACRLDEPREADVAILTRM